MIDILSPIAKLRQKRPGKWVMLGMVAILLLAGTGGSVVYKKHLDREAANNSSSANGTSGGGTGTGNNNGATSAVTEEQRAFNSVTAQTQKLDLAGQYDDEAKTLKTYLDANPTAPAELTTQASIQLGAAYFNAKDYPNALVWYQKTLDTAATPNQKMAAIHGLALTYKWSGDKASAIAQYKAAIAIAKTQPDDDQSIRIIKVDTTAIDQLGGTP